MKSQDLITFLFTFLCGFAAGGYLYVIGFAPQMAKVSAELLPEPDPSSLTTIEGYMYGGCERTGSCASFFLTEGGEYNYLTTSVPTTRGPYGGTLAKKDWRTIASALSVDVLEESSTPLIPDGRCAHEYDLVDYHYAVTYHGVIYEIDTCDTSLDRESVFGQDLDWLWQFFAYDIVQ